MARISLVFAFTLLGFAIPAAADEASHRQAADDFLQASGAAASMDAAATQMIDLQAKQNPAIAGLRDVMKKFMNKYVSYSAVKEDLISLYVEEFTESELKELAAFYRTPVGKKAAEKVPVMMAKGAELGMKKVQANQAELIKMIQAEMAKKAGAPQQ
jgi:hypothetical protein